ncbi:MAG: hypothetical protein VX899_12180 [Myxococcota bacterium]|nr:hypothetical protein [Myxococcota bacterium]
MLLLPILLSAPAQAAPEVHAELITIKDVQVGMRGASFTAVVALTRESGMASTLTDVEAELWLNGVMIGDTALHDQKIKLPKGQAVLIEVPAQIGLSAGTALMRAAETGQVDMQVKGEATGKALIFSRSMVFEAVVDPEKLSF